MRPHLEYASPVWDPYRSSHKDVLETFALRISYRAWKKQYSFLAIWTESLAVQRKVLKLYYDYHLQKGDFISPGASLIPRNLNPQLRTFASISAL